VKEVSDAILFISAESAECAALRSSLASRTENGGPVVSLFLSKAGKDVVSDRFAYALDPTEKDRAEIYETVLSFVRRFDIQQIFFAPISVADLLAGVAATDISGAPTALFLSECTDFPDLLGAGDLIVETVRKSSIVFASTERVRADAQKRFGRKVWIFRPEARPGGFAQREDYGKWIRQSSALRKPVDDRFERLSNIEKSRTTPYVDPDPPADLYWEFHPLFRLLTRLQSSGYQPDFVVDVGASTGYWSHVAAGIYPKANFILIEPLLKRYLYRGGTLYDLHPEFIVIEAAAGAANGELTIHVSPDLYGSSFFDDSHPQSESELVPVKMLDDIANQQQLRGRGILKIDVQFSEHLVLEGAKAFLQQIDFIIVETCLEDSLPGILTFSEMIAFLKNCGFRYFDHAGCWRDSLSGELRQEDVVVARINWKAS